MKYLKFWMLFSIIILLTLAIPGAVAQAQEGLTVTVPGGDDTIPPATWDPDNLILIAGIAVIIVFSIFGAVVAYLGNKLYLSLPQWAQPGAENIVRSGLVDAIELGDTIVGRTPSTLDDEIWERIEIKLNEIANRIFREANG